MPRVSPWPKAERRPRPTGRRQQPAQRRYGPGPAQRHADRGHHAGRRPSHGLLTLNADGTFSYTHDGSENFSDSFTYRVFDALGHSDTATVSITITPVNDNTPVADAESFTVAEGGTATEADLDAGSSLLSGDTDLDLPNDTLTVDTTPVVGPSHGLLTLNADGTFSYTHDGSENFTTASPTGSSTPGHSDTATVSITITPVNDNTPVADAESFTVAEGGTATEADLDAGSNLLSGDTDLDLPNDTLTVDTTPVVGPSHGLLTLNADGTFSYTHDGSENFTDSFTYRVYDALGHSDTATVSITITPVNDNTPVADAESFTVAEGGTATEADLDAGSSLLSGDTDLDLPNDTLTVDTTPVVGPSHGLLTLNADGTFSYTHDGSENFTDSFTYRVSTPWATATRPRSRSRSRRSTTTRRWPTPRASRWPKAERRPRPTGRRQQPAQRRYGPGPAQRHADGGHHAGRRSQPRPADPERGRHVQLHPRRQREFQRQLHLPGLRRPGPQRHGHGLDHDHAGQRQHAGGRRRELHGGRRRNGDRGRPGRRQQPAQRRYGPGPAQRHAHRGHHAGRRPEPRPADPERGRHVQLHPRRQREFHRQLHLPGLRRPGPQRHGHGLDHDHAGQRQHAGGRRRELHGGRRRNGDRGRPGRRQQPAQRRYGPGPAQRHADGGHHAGRRSQPRPADPERGRHVQLHPRRQREFQRQLHLPGLRRPGPQRHGHGLDHDHAGQRQHAGGRCRELYGGRRRNGDRGRPGRRQQPAQRRYGPGPAQRHAHRGHHAGRRPEPRPADAERGRDVQLHPRRQREFYRQLHLPGLRRPGPQRHGHGLDHDHPGQRPQPRNHVQRRWSCGVRQRHGKHHRGDDRHGHRCRRSLADAGVLDRRRSRCGAVHDR